MNKNNKSGFFAILGTAVIYGSYGCLARYLNDSFGVFTQIFFRAFVGFLLVLAILLFTRSKFTLSRKDLKSSLLLGVYFVGGVILFTVGSILDKISVVMFVFYAGSFTVSFLLSTFVYHEKLSRQKMLAFAIVLIGLVVTTGLDFSNLSWGLLAAFGSGILDALANNMRKQLSGLSKEQVLSVQLLVTSCVAFVAILLTQEQVIKDITPAAIIAGIAWGGFWVLGNRLIMVGFKNFDFMLGQIVLSSEIFFATVMAYIFFREVPGGFELLGGIMIFVGVCLVDFDFTKLKGIGSKNRSEKALG